VNGYVEAGWSVTAAGLGLYTWRLMHRSRLLTRLLPPEPPPTPLPAETLPIPRVSAPLAPARAMEALARDHQVPGPEEQEQQAGARSWP
jgi:hypothetical protein